MWSQLIGKAGGGGGRVIEDACYKLALKCDIVTICINLCAALVTGSVELGWGVGGQRIVV